MSTVTQFVSNYVLGISEQPDELKLAGQVKDLKNDIKQSKEILEVVIKSDARGSAEAIVNQIENIESDKINIKVI